MKSKNMTLMVVAIGCGLVAAFLTAKLSGGSGPEMVDIWVVKKEITVGTILPAEDKELDNLIMLTKLPKGSLPPDLVTSKEDLKGKRVNRTLRAGNYFAPTDIGADAGVKLPEGMRQYAIRTDVVRSAAGFVEAGKKVDVLLTEAQPNGKKRTGIILQNMLVLTVDQHARPQEGGGGTGRQQVTAVSLAVTPKQALLLSTAEARGEVKLILRDETSVDYKDTASIDKIAGFDQDDKDAPAPVKMTQIVVAIADVPLNTRVTGDNIDKYFALRDIPEELANSKSVKELKAIGGKYIVRPLDANQLVFSTVLGDEEIKPEVLIKEVVKEVVKEVQVPNKSGEPNATGPEQLPWPKAIAEEKSAFPRKFEQFLNNRSQWWIEDSPGKFRKVEPNSPELKGLPMLDGTTEKKQTEPKAEENRRDRAV